MTHLDFRNAISNANHDKLAEYANLIRENIHASKQINVVKSFSSQ